jgi:hypothetical protein
MAEAAVTDIARPKPRPFTLGDAMILIIALALGLALARPDIRSIAHGTYSVPHSAIRTQTGVVQLGGLYNLVVLSFLFFLLPAFLILRLKRPRPRLRSTMGQPGFAACAAPFAVYVGALLLSALAPSGAGQRVFEIAVQVLLAAAVPLAWVSLIATRRWDPEPSWIDRLGRSLGALWMVSVATQLVLYQIPY